MCSNAGRGGEPQPDSCHKHGCGAATDSTPPTSTLQEGRCIESVQATSAELELPSHDHDMHIGPSLTLGREEDSKQQHFTRMGGAALSGAPALRSSLTQTDTRSSRFRSFHLGAEPTTATAALPAASGKPLVDTGEDEPSGVGLGLEEDDRVDDDADDVHDVDVDFVMHAGFPDLPPAVPLTFTLTMYACLSRTPEERPTFAQIRTLFKDLGEELSGGKYINSLGQPEVRVLFTWSLFLARFPALENLAHTILHLIASSYITAAPQKRVLQLVASQQKLSMREGEHFRREPEIT